LNSNDEPVPLAPVRPEAPTFTELGARPETVAALAAIGITRSFAIQEYAIPIAIRGVDLIGQAPTGTGKTLGFGVPLLERLIAPGEGETGTPQALVVVPTRELGLQVARDIEAAGRTRGVRVLPVYGGVAYEPQVEALQRGVEVIVGTPGRLLDLAKPDRKGAKPHLRLDGITALVLDEADRMLDLGFLEDVEKILAMLPTERQTMLFSATMPDPISTLARRFLHHPVTIHANHSAETGPSPMTKQFAYRTHSLNKVEVVARILQAEGRGLTMIFTRTKRAADRAAEDLDFRGFAVAAVHGDLGQGARERALRAFRNGKVDVLVATDVAARGLDVTGVTHVINYDSPEDTDTYVHRIGRTGRAGATGVAVTFVDWEDLPRWALIDKTLGLDLADPLETYHTSPHLFRDLNIDPGVSGTLPSADRTRAGLGAEVEEDLGGTRRRGKTEETGRGRGGRGGRPLRGSNSAAAPEAPAAPTDAAEGERGRPARRRRRAGSVVANGDTAPPTTEATPESEATAGRAPRSRTRRPASRTVSTDSPAGDSPAADAAPTEVTEDGGASAPRRRRRGRRSA